MLQLEEELFSPLVPWLRDDAITDINFNGTQLWVDHLEKGRYQVEAPGVTETFLARLAAHLSNRMNASFNPYSPVLEAETQTMRISLLHESVTNTGKSLSIRKAPAIRRLDREKMVAQDYCSREMDQFMETAVRAGCSVIVAGLPGAGKTEYVKALTAYIPPYEKVITIEDNLEIHYHAINPGKDCVEIKVNPSFTYSQAIKASMRQLPRWILLSEARSQEVAYLLESMSTGAHCLTTIHADDVRKIPDRICNMIKKDVTSDVYSFVDLGVLVQADTTGEGRIRRYIRQIAAFSRQDGVNHLQMLYEEGIRQHGALPLSLQDRLRIAGQTLPFCWEEGDPLCGA